MSRAPKPTGPTGPTGPASKAGAGEPPESPTGARRCPPWVWLCLFLLALLLRGLHFSRLGLSHYDEGVYALSAIGIADPEAPFQLFPGEERFSPPVYFTLAGLVARIFSVGADTGAIALNVVLGSVCVLALALVARRWFGDAAGLAAGVLFASSEFHVALSRTALTDVAFSLAFLAALFVLTEAFQRRSLPWALLGGLAVGLAWNTKYHGWLALGITGLALVPDLLAGWRARNGDPWRLLGLWAAAALVAGACYLPWALYIEAQPGGYAGLVAYQRTMLDPRWIENALRQGLHQVFFEGPVSRAGLLAAFGAAAWCARTRLGSLGAGLATLGLFCVAALTLGAGLATALLALLALPRLLGRGRGLPGTVVAIWLAVWIVLTPTYHPYARLVLPFTLAAALAAGVWIAARLERLNEGPETAPTPWICAALACLVGAVSLALPDPSDPWRATLDCRRAAASMLPLVPEGSRVIVLGEPNLAYYLQVAGRPALEVVLGKDLPAVLANTTETVYVVAGIYAKRGGSAEETGRQLGARFELLRREPFEPTDVRLLDDFAPRRAYAFRSRPTREYELALYRVGPAAQDGR